MSARWWRSISSPCPTITCRVLFVFVVLAHDRRRILHVNVTPHPTSTWTRQQLREAFPWHVPSRFLLHDRDAIFDVALRSTVAALGLAEVRTAPRSPWQNPFVERVIGSIRRECLDHVIVLNERHLRRVLRDYVGYYHRSRTHLALDKDTPESRPVDAAAGRRIVAVPAGRRPTSSLRAARRVKPTAGSSHHSALSLVKAQGVSIGDTLPSLRLVVSENGAVRSR